MKGKRKGLGKKILTYLLALAMVISVAGFQVGIVRAEIADNSVEENKSEEGTPEENKSGEETSEENKSEEGTPEENKSEEGTPEENKSGEETSEENKSEEGTPEENKSGEGTPEEVSGENGIKEENQKVKYYTVSYYMIKNGVTLPEGTNSDPTKNWDNLNKSVQVTVDPQGSTTDKDLIYKVLGDSRDVLSEYDHFLDYNGNKYTYAKAEVFRIMKEDDYATVGYHADCRMIRGYGDEVPYAENDVFVLYVDEDGTEIDHEYIAAQDGEITVTKTLGDEYNKKKNGKKYTFSNWTYEDEAVAENGIINVGDKKAIVLTASYVENPIARFFLLYKDKNNDIPSGNVDDPVTKYTKTKVAGALKKGVVTYEKDGVLAKADEGYNTVEDYIKEGPSDQDIKNLLIEAGYTEDDIERFGLSIDWFRTMSYSNEEFYHVDGRVVSETENVKVTVIKKDGSEVVGYFRVEKGSKISASDLLAKYSGLEPAEGYNLSWENEDGSKYEFGKELTGDTDVYVAYTEKKSDGGTPSGGNPDGGTPNGGNPSGGNPGGETPSGDNPAPVEIEDDDTPLSPAPEEDTSSDIDDDEDIVELDDEDTPLSDAPDVEDESTTIEDEEAPLSDNPLTGDSAPVAWIALALMAAFGLATAFVTGKRKKQD